MNRLILIGNGFDLAHGLKTSYKDFIDWYWSGVLDQLKNRNIYSWSDELCSLKTTNVTLWEVFVSCPDIINGNACAYSNFNTYIRNWNNGHIGYSTIIFNESSLIQNICKSIETKGWADIESEYYNLLLKCGIPEYSSGRIISVTDLNKQMGVLQGKLVQYLTEVEKNNNIVRNDEFYKKIYAHISEQDLSIRKPSSLDLKIEDIMLLDFNYTNTADQYVDAEKCVHIHIHGNLDNPDSVIFGYGDELDENYKQLQNKNDNKYLDNVKSIRYFESDNCRKVLQFIESAPFQVCIMGHSCGNSDRTLLNTIFEHKNCISIKSYYYKRKDGSDDFRERGQNISRIFNNPELMRYRVVSKDHCEPLT